MLGYSVALLLLQVAAFPGAQGFGADTPGGRGGPVLIVDRLADDRLPGSLRWAVEQTGPRTIVFEVSGIIALTEPLRIGGGPRDSFPEGNPHAFLTVAGESAPGGGITLTNYPLTFTNDVHDVIVRHLRVRNTRVNPRNGSIGDGIAFMGAHRVVVDHVSVSWFVDEGISLESTAERMNYDITVQHAFVAEGLFNGGHPSGRSHSRCAIISDGSFNISLHHNVFLSCNRRSPNLGGNSQLGQSPHPLSDVRYNLVYNPGEKAIQFARGAEANIVGNWIRFGPGTSATHPLEATDRDATDTHIYLEANCWLDAPRGGPNPQCPEDQTDLVLEQQGSGRVTWATHPFEAPPVEPLFDRAEDVLWDVGTRIADAADARFREQYVTGSGELGAGGRTQDDIEVPEPVLGWPAPDSDRDGLPDTWEHAQGLDPGDGSDSQAGVPYSHLERYLHERAQLRALSTTNRLMQKRQVPMSIVVYPSPADQFITIDAPRDVQIVDILGRTRGLGRGVLSTLGWPNGVYAAYDPISASVVWFVVKHH